MRVPMILALALVLPALVLANIPEIPNCFATMTDGPFPRYCLVVPDASGPPLTEARLDDGTTFTAVITVTLLNINGDPIVDYPAEDLWADNECGVIAICAGGSTADQNTDAAGQTTFTGPFAAGGHSTPGCGMIAFVAGQPLPQAFDLRLNSPDITGDLLVNLSDITLFTQALAAYDWAADFNSDGSINLSDITLMAQGIGAVCP